MTKKKWWILLSALLFAASAFAQAPCDKNCSAQPAKVWRDADLLKPLARSSRQPSAEELAGLKARQFDAGFQGELQPQGGTYYPPDPQVVAELRRERRLPRASLEPWQLSNALPFYASPFYPPPFFSVAQSRQRLHSRRGGGR